MWDEPPRLRHQLARLLSSDGHQVVFFEKPTYPWYPRNRNKSDDQLVVLARTKQLVHHKLRLNRFLYGLNRVYEVKQIRRELVRTKHSGGVIVNFNYDYDFLRAMFPDSTIVTVINDDHTCTALFGYTKPLDRVLARTCRKSDYVYTVSFPLRDALKRFCEPLVILPWADIPYRKPRMDSSRNILLFWGYIDRRIDWAFVRMLAKAMTSHGTGYQIWFVGPQNSLKECRSISLEFPETIVLRPAQELDRLPIDNVLCGIIPYRPNDPEIEAITLSNKASKLLAYGLPLAVTGMPHFLAKPFVYRLDVGCSLDILSRIQREFYDVQPDIECFIRENSTAAVRKRFIETIARKSLSEA